MMSWFIFLILNTSAYKQEVNKFMQLQLCNVLMKQTLFVDDIDGFSFSSYLNDYILFQKENVSCNCLMQWLQFCNDCINVKLYVDDVT